MMRIHKCMGLVTIQDAGRSGHMKEGIPRGGWMDAYSAQLANWLIGNDKNASLLEGIQMDLTFEVTQKSMMVVTGADVEIQINGQSIQAMNTQISLMSRDLIRIRNQGSGWISYISFSGGILLNKLFGSGSTYLPASFGGMEGRPIRQGDEIKTGVSGAIVNREIQKDKIRTFSSQLSIRFLPGPEFDLFSKTDRSLFLTESFRIGRSSNRMGYRLTGPSLRSARQIDPGPILMGTIQVPMDGHPIILMADCQTTGGYSRIGQVIRKDLEMLAQLKPESQIRFRLISHGEAKDVELKHL